MENLNAVIKFLEGLLKETKNPNTTKAILELSITTALERLKVNAGFSNSGGNALLGKADSSPVNFADLEDKAAMFLELLNISGDTMVDLNHNVEEGKEGAMYLHDIMAAFVEDLSKISA